MEENKVAKSENPSGERTTGSSNEGANVESKEDVKNEKAAERGDSGRKRSNDRDRDRSRDRQYERDRQRRGERSRGDRGPKGSIYKPRTRPECRVYISNIPYEYRWQDLKDLFRNEVGEVSFVELFEDEHGKPRGCGIIEFEKVEHARLALEKMHRYDLKGRKLVVKEDFDVERDECGRVIGGGRNRRDSREEFRPPLAPSRDYRDSSRGGGIGGGGSGVGGVGASSSGLGTLASPSSTQWSNTYGLSPQFLESLGISGPLVNRVFVANLDYKVDDGKLREVFRLAGKVISAEVTKDKDGKSRGFGVVEMDHPVEAVQAISMFNNQMLYDRRMTVRMDREAERAETRPPKLPEGLRSIGMGLGAGGNPLHDVSRGVSSLPSSGSQMSSVGASSLGVSGLNVGLSSSDLGLSNAGTGLGSLGGVSGLGVSGLQALGASQAAVLQGISAGDLQRGGASTYGLGSSANGSVGVVSGLGSSSYGYSTDSLSGRGPSLGSVSDYDRRETYDGYRTSQATDRDRQDYRSTSATYDLGTRLGSLGSSTSSGSIGPVSGSRVSDTIVVTNLPVSCTWQDLRDKFCEVGDVLFADIRSKGTGIVRFSSERDAQRACTLLNRARMEGRTIEVDFY